MKIFIVGCAKSGTWLLLRLFHAFGDVQMLGHGGERNVKFVDAMIVDEGKVGIWKRTWNVIFSNHRKKLRPPLERQLEIIRRADIRLVYIRRDRAAVLKSDKGWVAEARYDDCELQAKEWAGDIDFVVNFEDLISDPDTVQRALAEALGLTIVHAWSDYPDFVPDAAFALHDGKTNYSKRRIGAKY